MRRAPVAPERRSPWIGSTLWPAFAVLAGFGAWAVLEACGLAWPSGRPILHFCPRPAEAAVDDRLLLLEAEQARQAVLQERLDRLRIAAAAVPPCPPPAPPEPDPAPSDLAAPDPEPPAEVAEAPPPPAPDIPEEAWEDQETDFLEGCWTLISDYVLEHIDTGEVISVASWEMCFDADGGGRQTLVFENGVTCRGDVEAAFTDGGRLQVPDVDDVSCDNNSRIFQRIMICDRRPDGTAYCESRTLETGGGAEVIFRR